MTEEVQTRIFDPFYTTKADGHGLGLASVLGIVHAHGGTIQVASTLGKGSRFEVVLPTVVEATVAAKPGTSPFKSVVEGAGTPTVLLIEDEELLRNTLSRLLRIKGFYVTEAADGRSALDIFRSNPLHVDVVLLDMSLPQMSGREVFDELRRIRPDVKVVLTTGYSQERVLSGMGDDQGWKFVRKPYEVARLCDVIQELLGKTKSENQT
jgi:CheY-like chemotaxis protein